MALWSLTSGLRRNEPKAAHHPAGWRSLATRVKAKGNEPKAMARGSA